MNGHENVRFTVEQIMRGIRQLIDKVNLGEEIAFDESTTLSEIHHTLFEPDEYCPLEFLAELSDFVGLGWSQNRWAVWLRLRKYKTFEQLDEAILQSRTVGDIARLLARRAPGVSLDSVSVFGRKCKPAGAFLGIVQLSRRATDFCLTKRIAPSTKLRDALANQDLNAVWEKLRWISGRQLPSLTYYGGLHRFHWPAWLLGIISTSVILVALSVAISISSLALSMISFFALSLVGIFVADRFVRSIVNPLPRQIRTFGDLARMVAA